MLLLAALLCTLEDRVNFGLEVRPILARRCFACHGPDTDGRQAGLALHTSHDAAEVITPGQPEASELLRRLITPDPHERMPEGGPPLPAEEIEVLRRWIEQGAHYGKHWSWEPIANPPIPEHRGDPVDGFLRRGLEERQLQPAPRAARSTLARRLAFDLTGLPPTSAQLEAFLTATDEELGWSALVDDLLSSPRYAERWARHWLDLVRYAETHGHEFDYGIPYAWRYRDSVIKAFEENVPWDRMIAEHLAGDLLPNPRIDQSGFNQSELATGFWWFTQEKHGPTDVRAEESDRVSNQIDVMSKAFLGVTAACARCHDHKFDAISAKDYAALSGLLRSSRRAVGFLDPNQTISEVAGKLEVIREQEVKMANALLRRQTLLPKPKPKSLDILFDCEPDGPEWFHDGLAFGVTTPANAPSTFRGRFEPAAYSMLDSGRISEKLQGSTRSPSYRLTRPYTWVRVRGTGTIRQMVDGYWMNEHNALLFWDHLQNIDSDQWQFIRFHNVRTQGHRAWIEATDLGDRSLQIDFVALSEDDSLNEDDFFLPVQGDDAMDNAVQSSSDFVELQQKRRLLESDLPPPPRGLIMVEGSTEDERVFVRGDHTNLGSSVPRGHIQSLGAGSVGPGSGRLQVAHEITSDDNPTAARVAVNRIWGHLFGRGLVATPDDLGGMGQPPTHPELLDHLAFTFRQNGWDIQHMIRRLVHTDAYRQSCIPADPNAMVVDPNNDSLHSMRLRRLESEAIRDTMLLLSGTLDETRYGPPVAQHLTDAMTGRGRPGSSGPLDGAGRRSIYLEVRRNFLDPFQEVFDRPVPATTSGQRRETSVPAQALAMMNDPFVHEQAEAFASRARTMWPDQNDRLRGMVELCFGRPPSPKEQTILEALDTTDLAHILFNAKAFLYRN